MTTDTFHNQNTGKGSSECVVDIHSMQTLQRTQSSHLQHSLLMTPRRMNCDYMNIHDCAMALPTKKRIVTSDDDSDAEKRNKLTANPQQMPGVSPHHPVPQPAFPQVQPMAAKVKKETITINDSSSEDNIDEPGLAVIMKSSSAISATAPTSPAVQHVQTTKSHPPSPQGQSNSASLSTKTSPRRTPTSASKKSRKPLASKAANKLYKNPSPRKRQKKSREFEAEASESSAESDDRSCEETDRNAKALFTEASNVYRSSILGVRNKSNALQDWRVATEPCSICARFAEFLQFFKR
jgi:hypothetical protein